MFPVIISTRWFNIYSYGLFVSLGYAAGTYWILKEAKREKLDQAAIFDMLLFQLAVGIAGSRLLYLVEYSPEPMSLKKFLAFDQGGLTFYGSLISAFIFDFLFLKYKRIPFWQVMDCVGLGLPIGIAIARFGCFLNGCCHGTPTNMPWGIVFPRVSSVRVHPTQIYESMAGLFIFFVLQKFRPKRRNYGEVFFICIGSYGILRFLIEFYRGDNPVVALGMTLSQLIGIGTALISIAAIKIISMTPTLRIPADSGILITGKKR